MNISQLLVELERTDGIFPGEAITQILDQKNESIPVLLTIMERSITEVDTLLAEEDYFGHIYAMFLLAQMREKLAYELLTDFFSLPEETTWELTGDILTEDLGRILASVSCGDTSRIKNMIENSGLESLIRAAAIDALLILYKIGELDRQRLVDYFKELFQNKLEKERSMVWNHLVVSSVNIYPEELNPLIKEAYAKNLVDDDFIPYENVEEALSCQKESVLDWLEQNPDYTLVTDAVADISKWLA
jgi:hypothetical protein